jgi:ribonucleoside-diphosphate reductase beta chain
LLSTEEIDEAFRWSRENEYLKKKAGLVLKYYRGADAEKKKVLSTLLESFLFYSGFFMPFWWASKAKLTNTADAIRLILRDEAVHGFYIGYKFQLAYNEASPERQKELKDFTYKILEELYQNEIRYTEELYDPIGITEYVRPFIRYQGNKALQNLGFEQKWSAAETEVLPNIMASLSPAATETHDFFSGAGSSYVVGKAEETDDEDWDF